MKINSVILSTFTLGIANGMMMLLVPLMASERNVSLVGIGSLLAVRALGGLLINIPASIAIHRFGQKHIHVGGMLIMALSCITIPMVDSLIAISLAVLTFGMGLGSATLARHSHIAETTETNKRGRKIANFATTQRIGMLLGPVIAGALAGGSSYSIAFLFAAMVLISASAWFFHFFEDPIARDAPENLKTQFKNLPGFVFEHRHIFLTAGLYVVTARMVRSVRQFILPLWGIHIALAPSDIGLILSISMAVEMVFLTVGGRISDSRGRKWSAIPSLFLLSIALILLPFSEGFGSFAAIALVLGMAHGLGGGMIMTLGADLAPANNVSTFLGSWRLMGDLSGTLSPLIIGWIGNVFMLATASVFGGLVGFAGCFVVHFWVKEPLSQSGKQD